MDLPNTVPSVSHDARIFVTTIQANLVYCIAPCVAFTLSPDLRQIRRPIITNWSRHTTLATNSVKIMLDLILLCNCVPHW
jgi:hypothetical protein